MEKTEHDDKGTFNGGFFAGGLVGAVITVFVALAVAQTVRCADPIVVGTVEKIEGRTIRLQGGAVVEIDDWPEFMPEQGDRIWVCANGAVHPHCRWRSEASRDRWKKDQEVERKLEQAK